MNYFTIDKTSGKGDGSFTVKPNTSLTGRGPYRGTVTVKCVQDYNEKRTVSCTKTFPLSKGALSVSGCVSAAGSYSPLSSDGSISVPNTAYYVKFAATTNAKKIKLSTIDFTYIAVGVDSQWLQAGGTLGGSQVDCKAALQSGPLAIPGDPGVSAAYNLQVIVGFASNTGGSSKTTSLAVTLYGSEDTETQKLFDGSLVQGAGSRTYSDISVTFSYPEMPAAGGTVKPQLSYSQTWGWNGATTGGGTITSGAEVSYSGTGVDASSGSVTVNTLGTAVKDRSKIAGATVTVKLNGKTANRTVDIYQAANAKTTVSYGPWSDIEVNASVNPIGKTGGSSELSGSQSRTRVQNYTSGATSALGNETNTSFSWSKVSGDGALTLNNSTVTATANSGAGTRSAVFRASANGKTKDITISQTGESTLSVSPETLDFQASGESKTFTITSNDSWTIS